MKSLRHFHLDQFTHLTHQIVLLIITMIILSVLLYKPVVEFHPVGNQPKINAVSPQSHTELPQASTVICGMHITDFLRFDTVKNEFILNAFIWFRYNPATVSADVINAFAFTKGEILQKSSPIITQHNGTTTALYTIRVQFSTILDYSRFPLDDHRIFLNLTNTAATADDILYIADQNNYVISENIYISGWEVVGNAVRSGYAPVSLGDETFMQPKTVFSLDLSKGDLRQLSLILLPLLFLFYLGLFTFSIRDITVAMTLPLASISGLFAYSFVIQTLAPQVGYMMLSDYLFLFFLFSTFVIFCVKSLTAVPEHIMTKHTLKNIEGATVIGLQVLLVVVWFLLIDVRGV